MKKAGIKKLIAVVLAFILIICFSGCGSDDDNSIETTADIENDVVEEDVTIADTVEYDEPIPDDVIYDNLVYDDYLYECTINDDIICDIVLIDVVVGETTEDEIREQLPEEYKDYDIEWGKVIGKYAVGTAIIVAVGFIDYATHDKAAYFFGTPFTVTRDAFAGAVAGAVINTSINCAIDGKPTAQKLKKYAVEGSADGFMWGAITSATKNIIRKQKLKFTDGTVAKILKTGDVVDKANNIIGKAYYKGDKIYYAAADDTIKAVFNSSGKQLKNAPRVLPANSIFQQAKDSIKYYSDEKGRIYRIGDELKENMTYSLKGYKYSTDQAGRIKSFSTNNLKLKDSNRTRLKIVDTLETIAKGSQKAGDHRGHLFGDLFEGDNSLGNIVAMSEKMNLTEYKNMETTWEKALKAGKNVKVSGEIVYNNNTQRPSKIIVKYVIDNGPEKVETFIN